MEYGEALKLVKTAKPKDSFMAIKMESSYDTRFLLPYKEGLLFMAAIEKAELLIEPYTDQHRITELNRKVVETTIMSNDEYIRIKIAALLGIKPTEVNPTPT